MNPTGLGGVRSQTGMHKVHSLQLSLTVTFFLFFYEAMGGTPLQVVAGVSLRQSEV